MKRHLLWAPFLALFACSNFNMGYTDGGNPIHVKDTVRDTVIVISDSLILPPTDLSTLSLLDSSFVVRAGNYVEFRYSLKSSDEFDSLALQGLIVSATPLTITANTSGTSYGIIDSLTHLRKGGNDRYQFTQPLLLNKNYGLRWHNESSQNVDIGALLLAGYSSTNPDANLEFQSTIYEMRNVASRTNASLSTSTISWKPIPVFAKDSILGRVHLPKGLQAYLYSSAEMANLLNNGSIANGYWKSSATDSVFQYRSLRTDTLFYVVRNDTSITRIWSDTVTLSRKIR